jgi:CheY-like chemotaxis protein
MIAASEVPVWRYGRTEALGRRVVLIAEEDEVLRERLATALRREGCLVIEVEDGLELEDYLEAALSPTAHLIPPDVIVAELNMAGYSGLEVLAHLRERQEGTRFILMTRQIETDDYLRAEELGADLVLIKPVSSDELVQAVQEA